MSAAVVLTLPLAAQQVRPDAGTVLEINRQPPSLPPPGGTAPVVVQPAPEAATFDQSIRLTPSAYTFEGNTLVAAEDLLQAVAPFVGKPTDMQGLLLAAAAAKDVYRRRGYILTEAYLPAQSFAASGGTVRIQILEARVGKAIVQVKGEGISQTLAQRMVERQLPAGAPISEYLLEKPILMLRDLAGFDAAATVGPGAQPGEADITVTVQATGPRFTGMVGADNQGPRSAGQARLYAEANVLNLGGRGDIINARVQDTNQSGTNLYRLGYSTTLNSLGTRLALGFVRSDYALGRQFAALGASGEAQVASLSLTQPVTRSRTSNVVGVLAVEQKDLRDHLTTPLNNAKRNIGSTRAGLLGNFIDTFGVESFTSYSLALTKGHLYLDGPSLTLDQGPAGLHTAGRFWKGNLDYQRAMFLSPQSRLTASLQGQVAWKNLTSAEKISLGGPTGVRGYPVGEGLGDAGVIASLEYRHKLPDSAFNTDSFASVFYDWGKVKFNEASPAFPVSTSQTLASAGLGLSVGTFGNFLFTTQVAWRTFSTAPASDPDKKPRVWISVQKWL